MKTVSICYNTDSTGDRAVASQVAMTLSAMGFEVFLPEAGEYRRRIAAVKGCDALVLVYSGKANEAEEVLSDIDLAFSHRKPIVPFIVESVEMNDELRYYLSRKHFLVADNDWAAKLEDLAASVCDLTGEERLKKKLATLTIHPDDDVRFYANGEYITTIGKEQELRHPLACGVWNLRFGSVETKFFAVEYEAFELSADAALRPLIGPLRSEAEAMSAHNLALAMLGYTRALQPENGITRLIKEADGHITGIGYVNRYGRLLNGEPFDDGWSFEPNGLAAVLTDGRWGVINRDGDWILPPAVEGEVYLYDNKIKVRHGSCRGLFGVDGRELLPVAYRRVETEPAGYGFSATMSASDEGWGYYNDEGTMILPHEFDYIRIWRDCRAVYAVKGSAEALYTLDGEEIIESTDMQFLGEAEGTCIVRQGQLYGYFDVAQRRFIVEPRFAAAEPFSQDLAAVESEGKVGIIDRHGEWFAPPVYDGPLSAATCRRSASDSTITLRLGGEPVEILNTPWLENEEWI